jgi:hypothetical protein
MNGALFLFVIGCTRPEPPADPPFCGEAATVCQEYGLGHGVASIELPTTLTEPMTEWERDNPNGGTCYASEEEVLARTGPLYSYQELQHVTGLWFDLHFLEGPGTIRMLDCAFVSWSHFPAIPDPGEEGPVGGLRAWAQFTPETTLEKVQELVFGMVTSWQYRVSVGIYDSYDTLYDWETWEDDEITRWRFCIVADDNHESWEEPFAGLECLDFAYDPSLQQLGLGVTAGTEDVPCY